MGHSVVYIRIYFLGIIVNLIYNLGAGILRAVGDSRRPLYFLIASCFTNIALDILLVAVLGMGVAGACHCHHLIPAVKRHPGGARPDEDR